MTTREQVRRRQSHNESMRQTNKIRFVVRRTTGTKQKNRNLLGTALLVEELVIVRCTASRLLGRPLAVCGVLLLALAWRAHPKILTLRKFT